MFEKKENKLALYDTSEGIELFYIYFFILVGRHHGKHILHGIGCACFRTPQSTLEPPGELRRQQPQGLKFGYFL